MGLLDIQQTVDQPHQGSGILGAVVGGVAGLIAGIATMNPTAGVAAGLGTAASLASAGSAIGGLAGQAIDPAKAASASSHVEQNAPPPMPKRLPIDALSEHPELQMAYIQDAKQALPMANLSQPQYQQYSDMLNQAHGILQNRLGVGNGL